MSSRMVKFAICLAPALPFLVGCTNSPSKPKLDSDNPIAVELGSPIEREVTDFQDFTGRLEAVDSVEILARVSGYLTKIAFDASIESGAEVKEGDLLFEIDKRPYQISLAAAEAHLAGATAELTVAAAKFARTEELFQKNVVPQADLDKDKGEKLRAEAAVLSADAAKAQATLDLEFAEIKAPFSGRISRSVPSIGDLITPSSGTLTNIVSVDPMHVYFDMDEPTLLTLQKMIREGRLRAVNEGEVPLLMGLTTDEGFPHRGKLDFAENRIDSNTGTIRVRGVFHNPKPERGGRTLSPGLFARIRLPIGEPRRAVLISERAIGRDQGQPFVYVVDAEGKVVYRRITLGALHDGMRVVTEVLSAEERIVINGLQRIRPNSRVVDIAKEKA